MEERNHETVCSIAFRCSHVGQHATCGLCSHSGAARTYGPFYVRTARPKTPVVYDEGYRFALGKAHLLRPGRDVTLMAIGVMVKAALDAAELLAGEGIDCRVLNAASLKPADTEAVLAAATETRAYTGTIKPRLKRTMTIITPMTSLITNGFT